MLHTIVIHALMSCLIHKRCLIPNFRMCLLFATIAQVFLCDIHYFAVSKAKTLVAVIVSCSQHDIRLGPLSSMHSMSTALQATAEQEPSPMDFAITKPGGGCSCTLHSQCGRTFGLWLA